MLAVVTRSGTSFYWAMRLLPRAKREAMFAIYAFCREVDDIADEPGDEGEKRRQLEAWRGEIANLASGKPEHPITRALATPFNQFGLSEDDFMAIIEGMEMDAGTSLRLADGPALELYCDRVACAVGRLSNRVFGLDHATGDQLAKTLGEALQLTNILRDIREDAERDHIYLPTDLLARHGIAATDPRALVTDPNLAEAAAELAARAEQRFAEAETVMTRCNRSQIRPALVMMAFYRRLFDRLHARGWRDIWSPVALGRFEKIWLVLRFSLF